MKITINDKVSGNELISTVVGNKAENFYMNIGTLLIRYFEGKLNRDEACDVTVLTSKGSAEYSVEYRSGSITIFENENSIEFEGGIDFPDNKYLKYIDSEKNSYKFYRLEKVGENKVQASWGRIQKREVFAREPYTYQQAWVKFSEKLAKGYRDFTKLEYADVVVEKEVQINVRDPKVKVPITPSGKLYFLLEKAARRTIEKVFVEKVRITEPMVKLAKRLFNKLLKQDNVEDFNKVLEELMLVAPRDINFQAGRSVQNFLAHSTKDFAKIIDREEAILSSMEIVSRKEKVAEGEERRFPYDIEVYVATDEQKNQVLGHLNDELKQRVQEVYRVIPNAQKRIFNEYIENNHIEPVKMFWHGSRTENWISIINNSLALHPNAVITGKMFGNGIYFAPSPKKSWGYTSGGHWNSEHSNIRVMGLYATAYGEPCFEKNINTYDKEQLNKLNKDCVHALSMSHGGNVLYNDEIIFFDEAAMLLNYIVIFDGRGY